MTAQYCSGLKNLHSACITFYQLAEKYMAQAAPQPELRHQEPAAAAAEEVKPEHLDPMAFSQSEWDSMLDSWDLGLGGENAREMANVLSGFSWNNWMGL